LLVVWYRRLWYDLALLPGLTPWPLPELPDDTPPPVVALHRGFALLFALRWMYPEEQTPVMMTGSFARAWCDGIVGDTDVPRLRKHLVELGVLERVGVETVGGYRSSIYVPGGGR